MAISLLKVWAAIAPRSQQERRSRPEGSVGVGRQLGRTTRVDTRSAGVAEIRNAGTGVATGGAPGSGRFVEPDRDAGGGDALQRGADVGGLDRVDLEIEADDRVRLVVFSFADQRPDRRLTFGFGRGSGGGAPMGDGFDTADGMMAAAAFEPVRARDLHDLRHRGLFGWLYLGRAPQKRHMK